MTNNEQLLSAAIEEIRIAVPDIIAIYYFGSFGTEYETTDSDLDLAILSVKPLDAVKCFYLAQKIACLINRDVDLIDLRHAGSLLKFQIIGTGERIYCTNEYVSECFADAAFSEYQLYNETHKDLLEDISQHGGYY